MGFVYNDIEISQHMPVLPKSLRYKMLFYDLYNYMNKHKASESSITGNYLHFDNSHNTIYIRLGLMSTEELMNLAHYLLQHPDLFRDDIKLCSTISHVLVIPVSQKSGEGVLSIEDVLTMAAAFDTDQLVVQNINKPVLLSIHVMPCSNPKYKMPVVNNIDELITLMKRINRFEKEHLVRFTFHMRLFKNVIPDEWELHKHSSVQLSASAILGAYFANFKKMLTNGLQ